MYAHQWMTTREAAQALSASVRSIQLWVDSGKLEATKTPGGHRRVSRESVARMLEKMRVAVEPQLPRSPLSYHKLREAGLQMGPKGLVERAARIAPLLASKDLTTTMEGLGRIRALVTAAQHDQALIEKMACGVRAEHEVLAEFLAGAANG